MRGALHIQRVEMLNIKEISLKTDGADMATTIRLYELRKSKLKHI